MIRKKGKLTLEHRTESDVTKETLKVSHQPDNQIDVGDR